jgi:hypothetical protein
MRFLPAGLMLFIALPVIAGPSEDAGISVRAQAGVLRVSAVTPGLLADSVGIRKGDHLLYLNGRKITSRDSVDGALTALTGNARLSAVIERKGRVVPLFPPGAEIAAEPLRPAGSLTVREEQLQAKQLMNASRRASSGPPRSRTFQISAEEKTWVRFNKGLPKSMTLGQTLEGETTTPMVTNKQLDYLALPRGSKIWATVAAINENDGVFRVRLHIYKIRPPGGRIYAISAVISGIGGDDSRYRISQGGSILAAPPEDDILIASPKRNFRITFLEPLQLHEPDSYYRAGPGLWLRSRGTGAQQVYEVTQVLPGRSAHHAGLQTGDRIYRFGGHPANILTFGAAIDRLYGDRGTHINVDFMRGPDARKMKVSLQRGVYWKEGATQAIYVKSPARLQRPPRRRPTP